MSLLADLAAELAGLEQSSLRRTRRQLDSPQGVSVVIDGRACLSFCSNDYLGLAAHPAIAAAARAGIEQYGTGAGASHLLTGHSGAHHALEQALARFTGFPSALLFSTGYMANLGVVTALLGRGDAVFADRLNHACLNDAALLSRARLHRFPHGDLQSLERQLRASTARRRLIAVDAVFSMDGDIAALPELLSLAQRHDAWLLVDDAHGFGVLGGGRGTLAHFGLDPERICERVICMGTLGKAAGVGGAFVAAHRTVIDWLVQSARAYIYTTAAPPAMAHTLRASLQLIRGDEGDRRRSELAARVAELREGLAAALPQAPEGSARAAIWQLADSFTAIQPLIVGGSAEALAASAALEAQGLWVPAIRPPTVPAGSARLRITLSASHSVADVDRLVDALALAARTAGAVA